MSESPFNRSEQKPRRQELRRHMTLTEVQLWMQLKGKTLDGLKFRRQQGIGPYIVDFYCPSVKLVVEIDGDSHFSPEGRDWDARRTSYLETLGVRVIRFTNIDIHQNMETVLEQIRAAATPPLHPLLGEEGRSLG